MVLFQSCFVKKVMVLQLQIIAIEINALQLQVTMKSNALLVTGRWPRLGMIHCPKRTWERQTLQCHSSRNYVNSNRMKGIFSKPISFNAPLCKVRHMNTEQKHAKQQTENSTLEKHATRSCIAYCHFVWQRRHVINRGANRGTKWRAKPVSPPLSEERTLMR